MIEAILRLLMLFQDPPDHALLRGLASKAFTPRTVERLRSRIERLVDDFLSPYLSTGEMDVVPALAVPLPPLWAIGRRDQ